MASDKITFLFNWHAIPYHAPVFLAQSKGFFAEEGIKVALLEPNDPSDVTEIIGSGKADMGLKAMIHTIAAKARGFPVTSIGTLMDEPFTGVIYLEGSGITSDFRSLKGKRIGYVGEFGKIQIDELTRHFGMTPNDYEAVRVGMSATEAIQTGRVHAAIGLENVQMVELEEWCKTQGRPTTDVKMLRIDELAELGCCCFCTILFIGNDEFIQREPAKVRAFMRAVKKASDFLHVNPRQAWEEFKAYKKIMDTPVNAKIFERSFAYMSKDCANVPRDWAKVTKYSKRLGIVAPDFEPNATNSFLSWQPDADVTDPEAKQKEIAAYQRKVAEEGGILSVPVAALAA
ncbi:putative thiamine biosynthesis protein [Tilletiaria anomala UBC 951]|uniref:4-amino-5-hydroxymethyl-2-methylpyrimidine phosphate synthase n=1 Tax=Tilletiaria anomala (strain ATCC 24038 / CBS 436.72 / UBC 951) TaxID=1037660 RepID=A0A066W3P4_TILAU|nr:putative thiamine biosynthesis protein [Tilletiaria anomala UBC 951]KDN47178.1 putative thiamine biosynthesis protein [Tilletiaria anomala UBC 951]